MPPNAKGGKGYKKGKHATDMGPKMLEWDDAQGQMLGRVLKKLGDRRFRIFCNDNKERICKLCGSMRKSDWVDEGALVVIGTRELSNARADGTKAVDLGDVLAVVDPRLYSKLKKLPNQNQLLFQNLESTDEIDLKRKIKAQEDNAKRREEGKAVDEEGDDDGGIVFDREGDTSGEGENDDEWNSDSESDKELTSLPAGKLTGKARDKLKARMSEQRARSETFATQRAKSNKATLTGGHTTSSGSHTDGRKNMSVTQKDENDEDKEINIDDI